MWPFVRKRDRRQDLSRIRNGARSDRLRALRQPGSLKGLWIGLLFAAAGSAILLLGGRAPSRQLGERLDQPLLARVAFQGPDLDNPQKVRDFRPDEPIARNVIDESDMLRLEAENQAFIAVGGAGSLALHVIGLACVMLLITAGLALLIVFRVLRVKDHLPGAKTSQVLQGILIRFVPGGKMGKG